MKSFIKYSRMVVLAAMVSFVGCGDDEEDLRVTASFTFTFEKETGVVTFINTSENARNYEWDFGDGETSTEINPVHTYETGTYSVVLKASNRAGASDVFENELELDLDIPFALPLSFDSDDVELAVTAIGGAQFAIVDNPDVDGTNNKETRVAAIINSGAKDEGVTLTLEDGFDLSEESVVALNFWSDVAVPITMKLEDTAAPAEARVKESNSVETNTSHSGNGWEIIEFDFGSSASGEFSVMTIYVDKDGTTSGVFYFDDTQQGADFDKTPPVITLIGESTIKVNQGKTFTDPGATATDDMDGDISEDIEVGGDIVDILVLGKYEITYNVTDAFGNKAEEVTRTVEVVDASLDVTPPEIMLLGDATITLTVGDSFNDPGASATDDIDGDISSEDIDVSGTVDTDVAGTYVLTYSVSDAAGNTASVDRMVIVNPLSGDQPVELVDNGDFSNGTTSWYSGNPANVLQVDTEGGESFFFAQVDLAGNSFDVNLSQLLEIVEDGEYTLTFDASTGAGNTRSIVVGIGLSVAPFTDANQTVNLTENTQTFEIDLTATGFGGTDSRVYFDLGADVGVVVIDNVSLVQTNASSGGGGSGGGGGGGSTCNASGTGIGSSNGDFETGDTTGWLFFDNNGTASIDNSTSSGGGSSSGSLATNGQSNPGLKQERFGIGTVQPGDEIQVCFDHKGTLSGDGGVLGVLLFVEGDPIITHEFLDPAPVLSSDWTTFSDTYTIPGGADVSGGISLLIQAVCGGAAGCGVSANIDNVSVTILE